MNENPEQNNQDRLARIAPAYRESHKKSYQNYSRVIKRVQIVLPILALGILLVTLNWNRFQEDAITPMQERAEEMVQPDVGKNELLNPRFESVDDKNQPYMVTAQRAVQAKDDEDLVTLEKPSGEIRLNSGNVVSIRSETGTYKQEAQQLFLQDKVQLFYDDAYEMNTQELYVDMQASKAWSDVDVSAKGPEGTLEAKGLKGSTLDDTLIFTGPAKLVLLVEEGGLDIGGLAP